MTATMAGKMDEEAGLGLFSKSTDHHDPAVTTERDGMLPLGTKDIGFSLFYNNF